MQPELQREDAASRKSMGNPTATTAQPSSADPLPCPLQPGPLPHTEVFPPATVTTTVVIARSSLPGRRRKAEAQPSPHCKTTADSAAEEAMRSAPAADFTVSAAAAAAKGSVPAETAGDGSAAPGCTGPAGAGADSAEEGDTAPSSWRSTAHRQPQGPQNTKLALSGVLDGCGPAAGDLLLAYALFQ